MSESFGGRLRRERERRHIDLASIAGNTKVKAALFEGLERDDVSRWPSGIFRRSFIRVYANAIGLDPEPIVREFLERFPDPAEPVQPATTPAGSVAAEGRASTQPEPLLRLTLAETGVKFAGGRVLNRLGQRWSAAAWDAGVVLAIGISLFMVIGEFWSSFGVAMLCYYVGGILILGNTPGVCLFAPRPRGVEHSDNRTVAVPAAVPPSPPAAEPSSQSPSTVYPFATARRRARMN